MAKEKKALFLDRDGVINVDHGYVHKIEDFDFVEGIFDLCRSFQQAGFRLIVVTNQAGIGRGLFGEADFAQLTRWMLEAFAEQGVTVSQVYHCPYYPGASDDTYLKLADWRKPAPGMLLQAAKDWQIDLTKSVMIGDKPSDMQAAAHAGVGRKILLASRYHDAEVNTDIESVEDLRDISP